MHLKKEVETCHSYERLIAVTVPERLADALERACEHAGISVSQAIEEALTAWLAAAADEPVRGGIASNAN